MLCIRNVKSIWWIYELPVYTEQEPMYYKDTGGDSRALKLPILMVVT